MYFYLSFMPIIWHNYIYEIVWIFGYTFCQKRKFFKYTIFLNGCVEKSISNVTKRKSIYSSFMVDILSGTFESKRN